MQNCNPTLDISVFANVWDNSVKQEQMPWSEFANDLIANRHMVVEDKNLTPMFNVTRFKSKEEGAQLADSRPRKLKDNTLWTSGVILDFDKDTAPSMHEFALRYSDVEWLMYTSYNHKRSKDDNYCEKYRVIIPWAERLPVQMVEHPKNLGVGEETIYPALAEYFFGCDRTCFQPFRSFFIPSCPPGMLGQASILHNQGEVLQWQDLPRSQGQLEPYVPKVMTGVVGGTGRILWGTFDIVRWAKDEGLYLRAKGDGKHDIRCPLWLSHTSQDTTGTCIWEPRWGRLPGIKCHHHGGELITLKWLFAQYREMHGIDYFREYCECEDQGTELLKRCPYKSAKSKAYWLRHHGITGEEIARLRLQDE